jgi:3-oxoacyl-(acyl-carrier-protein) synthase
MNLDCTDIERIVWTEGPEAAPASHIEGCASCREQTRQAADLRAALVGLRTRFASGPADLDSAILQAISRKRLDKARDIVSHPKFWRGAAVGAAAAATAAVGLLVARRRLARPELDVEPSLVA